MSPAAISPNDDQSSGADATPTRHERQPRRSSSPRQPPNRDRTHTKTQPPTEDDNGRRQSGTQPAAERRKHEYEPGSVLVRRAPKGTGYQARGWVYSPPVGSINLGLFRGEPWQDEVVSERLAAAVAVEFRDRSRRVGVCPLEVFFAMQAEGKIRPAVLPPGAKRVGGAWIAHRSCAGGVTITLKGTYPTARDAARAFFAEMRKRL